MTAPVPAPELTTPLGVETPVAPDTGAARGPGQLADIRRRFARNRLAVLGLAMVLSVFFVAAAAPLLAPSDPYRQDLANTQASPSAAHWFGTDQVGRDQLSRVLYGTRIAVLVGLASIVLALLVGILLGAVAGYLGRFWDTLVMRVADVFLAFPVLVGAILVITVTGKGLASIILALAIFGWATPSRLVRSSILSVRESEYVEAARSLGASRRRIVFRHILPNSLAPVLVYGAVAVPAAIVAEAALTYLGVGLAPGSADWGQMIADGQKFFAYKDHLWFFPSMALVFTTLGFVFVADGLRDALDPRLKGSDP